MTEKFTLGWKLNPMPLTFWASALTARLLRHLSVVSPNPFNGFGDTLVL